ASFIGEESVLRARLEHIDDKAASVAVGSARVAVPAGPLAGQGAGALVGLFVRPGRLRIGGGEGALDGSVSAVIFRGDHIDLYVEAPHVAATRVLIRLPQTETAPQVGDRVTIVIDGRDATAFPCEA